MKIVRGCRPWFGIAFDNISKRIKGWFHANPTRQHSCVDGKVTFPKRTIIFFTQETIITF